MVDFTSFFTQQPTTGAADEGYAPAYSGASYNFAADVHNVATGSWQITDPTTWGQGLDNFGMFLQAATVSGAASLYNSGVAAYNYLGGEAQELDVAAELSSYDSDLGKYYEENRDAIDLVGFIGTSIIPGTAGVKALNIGTTYLRSASKTGFVGENLSKATGLLRTTDELAQKAGLELSKQSATMSQFNADTLRTLASGYGAAALEATAFELAVAGTMFKSPILDNADAGDIAKNILIGAGVGGVIGGTFTAIKSLARIKGIIKEADEAAKPFSFIPENVGVNTAEDTYLKLSQLENLAPLPGVDSPYFERFSKLRSKQEDTLRLETYSNILKLSNGNAKVADALHPQLLAMGSDNALMVMSSLEEIGVLGSKLKAEDALTKFAKTTKATGSAQVMEATGVGMGQKAVRYIKLHGDNTGSVFDDAPKVFNLADNLPKGKTVDEVVRGQKFKEKDIWNPLPSLKEPTSHLTAEARYIWAEKYAKLTNGQRIGELDVPLLEAAQRQGLDTITVVRADGTEYVIPTAQDIANEVRQAKGALASTLMEGKARGGELAEVSAIAKIVNVKESYLMGQRGADEVSELYARQAYKEEFTQRAVAKGVYSAFKPTIDLDSLPSWGKAGYDLTPVTDIDGFVTSGMATIVAKQKLYQQQVLNVFADETQDLMDRFVDIPDELVLQATRYGANPGLFSFVNGNYGTLNSFVESIGAGTAALRKARKDAVIEQLNPVGLKLVNNPTAAIEFEAINQRVASTAEHYVPNPDGSSSLIPRKQARYLADVAAGKKVEPPAIQEGAPMIIAVKELDAWEAIKSHIDLNGKRVGSYKKLRAAQGKELGWDENTFYPIRPNPKDYKFIAFVVDEKVTGAAGHVKMIHARDAATLEQMVSKVPSEFKVYTRPETEEFRKLRGEYEHDRALTETYMDVSLKRNGVNSQFFQKTDPQKIVEDIFSHHTRAEDTFARELVNARYEKPFLEFRRMAEQYDNLEKSTYGSSINVLEDTKKNPYLSYLKTSLDIQQISDYPLLNGFNNIVESAFSKAYQAIGGTFNSSKSVEDLDKVHSALEAAGVKSAYYDAATTLLANHPAPKNELSRFVRFANSIVSSISLRLDPSNAMNNLIGQVMLATEAKAITSAIMKGNTEAAGKLTQLMTQKIPGTEEVVRSPAKLIGQAVKNFFDADAKGPLMKRYKANGWVTDLSTQYKAMLDDLTLKGDETAGVLNKKITAAFDKARAFRDAGEKATGNKFVEEFNRFISADVMRQLTDLAEEAGVLSSREASTYINTFVNRTQGNIQASQRPLMFQGPVGQAIGLFQTYQFNMLQQMFRHIGEGRGKDAAFLLGLQGTLYGANGLPGFSYLNTHIVGTASGNPEHRDIYSSTYGIFGKDAGDLLLYGAASNILGANLYTRGDINPRQLTLIPVNPADIPIVTSITRVAQNLSETIAKLGGGGDVKQVLLQGLEHNGLSRPLAGIAQTLQGLVGDSGQAFSTSKQGNMLYANDLYSIASMWRVLGSRPIDESIVNDAVYRISAYQASDREKRRLLSETVKSTAIDGGQPDLDQIEQFASRYAETGGQQKNFNKWMLNQMQASTELRANEIASALKTPYSKNMQLIMGGRDLDGTQELGLGF